jgi:hypothetical protein
MNSNGPTNNPIWNPSENPNTDEQRSTTTTAKTKTISSNCVATLKMEDYGFVVLSILVAISNQKTILGVAARCWSPHIQCLDEYIHFFYFTLSV